MTKNRTHHRPSAFALSALLLASVGCTPNVTERDLKPALLADLTEIVREPTDATILIDARTPSAFRAGHIAGARNLGIAEIDPEGRRRQDLANAEQIIVYGQNPGDALATGLALRMLEAGYGSTRLFRGGIDAWTGAGGELVTPDP